MTDEEQSQDYCVQQSRGCGFPQISFVMKPAISDVC